MEFDNGKGIDGERLFVKEEMFLDIVFVCVLFVLGIVDGIVVFLVGYGVDVVGNVVGVRVESVLIGGVVLVGELLVLGLVMVDVLFGKGKGSEDDSIGGIVGILGLLEFIGIELLDDRDGEFIGNLDDGVVVEEFIFDLGIVLLELIVLFGSG